MTAGCGRLFRVVGLATEKALVGTYEGSCMYLVRRTGPEQLSAHSPNFDTGVTISKMYFLAAPVTTECMMTPSLLINS